MSKIKKILGSWKAKIIDEWPYAGKIKKMPKLRESLKSELSRLPQIISDQPIRYEVHMLCGHRDYDMGIWASWSLMRFLKGAGKLFVHSDGSLTKTDIESWKNVIDEIVVVPRAEADQLVSDTFENSTKHLYHWRQNYGTSPQLVDAHQFGDARGMLIMDSDVLVFKNPIELLEALDQPDVPFAWCHDVLNAYSSSPELIKEVTGIEMPDRFNCGMLVTPRLGTEDYMWLDGVMETIVQDGRIDLRRYWACQTYYGMIAASKERAYALPDTYATTMGVTPESAVLRHYVGAPRVRYRFFEEGVPRLLERV